MKKQNNAHQQAIFDATGLLPAKSWRVALVHIAILILVVFLTEISNAGADMVFDFQMKLAEKGNAEAQLVVGEMYESGRGVEKDMEQAMLWINKAAEQGNKAAGYKLLYYDLEKNSVVQANKTQLDELIDAGNAGDGHAQYYLGLMHARGVGMRKDSTQAVNWLSKASLQGITAAEDEIRRISEAKQPTVPSNRSHKPVTAQPAVKAQVNQGQQQQKKTPEQSVKKTKQTAAVRSGKAEVKTGPVKRRQAERQTAENRIGQGRSTAQGQVAAKRQRDAILEQHAQRDQRKKSKYESDACNGKSARFLSSCR